MAIRPQQTRKPVSGKAGAGLGLGAVIAGIIGAVLLVEGGFVDHPNDPGGATNFGITERVAREHGFEGNMRNLPRQKAIDIYAQSYIDNPGFLPLVKIDPVVAEEVIDTAVNMGPRRPSRYFQRAVNQVCNTRLKDDGRIGRITVKAWSDCRANLGAPACVAMLDSLDVQQEREYDRLVRRNPKLRVFRRGWQNHRIGNVKRSRCGERVAT